MESIYCDGSCFPNPGPGGWGVWCESTGFSLNGGAKRTTNNRMELRALIEALKIAPTEEPCTIYSDSQYVVNGSMKWRHKWERHGWRKGPNSELVPNVDMWVVIALLMRHKPLATVEWVRGHSGNAGNEMADRLAGEGKASADEEGISAAPAAIRTAPGQVPGQAGQRERLLPGVPGEGVHGDHDLR